MVLLSMKYEKLYSTKKGNKKCRHATTIRFTPCLMPFRVMNDDTKKVGTKNTAGEIKDGRNNNHSPYLVHEIKGYIIFADNEGP